MERNFKDVNELPITLSVADVSSALGISRANAYNLMHSKEFPTMFIGKRMIVRKDRFVEWMDNKVTETGRQIT